MSQCKGYLMKALKDSLDKAVELLAGKNNDVLIARLFTTLERMVELQAAVAAVRNTSATKRQFDD